MNFEMDIVVLGFGKWNFEGKQGVTVHYISTNDCVNDVEKGGYFPQKITVNDMTAFNLMKKGQFPINCKALAKLTIQSANKQKLEFLDIQPLEVVVL